jgi:hypothetical protein
VSIAAGGYSATVKSEKPGGSRHSGGRCLGTAQALLSLRLLVLLVVSSCSIVVVVVV